VNISSFMIKAEEREKTVGSCENKECVMKVEEREKTVGSCEHKDCVI
jgi:hypothetical protein